jgi:hypothetical protein
MKVLLLHSQDAFPRSGSEKWELVVDFGRAPKITYERWSRQAGCPIVSLYEFAKEVHDLGVVRQLLKLGAGRLIDSSGIDWWDVLSLEIVPQLQQLLLVRRLSMELDASCELYTSRPHPLATALQRLLGVRLTVLESRLQSVIHRASHYRDSISHLDTAQLAQVLVDKFDNDHSIRRRFARRRQPLGKPVILLPSAYVNVSRAALSYAELLPDHQFLLVHTRSNARVPTLPRNVRSASLTPYFVTKSDKLETDFLLESWNGLGKHLAGSADVFRMADATGLRGQIPALLRWGLALRDAWSQVFESENVTAFLSGDDDNPPSSIPLIIAKKRGLPALACHHGALNYMMAIKTNQADVYLGKGEMERDYLMRICNLAPEKIVAAPLSSKPRPWQSAARSSAPWLVFFTEPYQSNGWRSEEVYRDLLPRLCALAETTGLKLVFKLHPFESVKGHRRMLRRVISEHECRIEIVAGPPTSQLWSNTRFALTVQSSTAVECAALGLPVFLCAWLRDSFSGYVPQFARFGVGRVLDSPDQIADIPKLLEEDDKNPFMMDVARKSRDFCIGGSVTGDCPLPMASNG